MKIKKIIIFIALSVVIFPEIAFAQWSTGNLGGFGLPSSPIFDIIAGIMDWLLAILGIVGVIGFAISGVLYLTSAGDSDRMEKAKGAMLYSIIGIIVGLSGLVIIIAAKNMLSARTKF